MKQSTTQNALAWVHYWHQQGQSWRIEPEIDLERQVFLSM